VHGAVIAGQDALKTRAGGNLINPQIARAW
jgi:hypothetical protein